MGAIYFTITSDSQALNIIILFIIAVTNITFFVVWLRFYFSTFLMNLKKNEALKKTVGKCCGIIVSKINTIRERIHKIKVKDNRPLTAGIDSSVIHQADHSGFDLVHFEKTLNEDK